MIAYVEVSPVNPFYGTISNNVCKTIYAAISPLLLACAVMASIPAPADSQSATGVQESEMREHPSGERPALVNKGYSWTPPLVANLVGIFASHAHELLWGATGLSVPFAWVLLGLDFHVRCQDRKRYRPRVVKPQPPPPPAPIDASKPGKTIRIKLKEIFLKGSAEAPPSPPEPSDPVVAKLVKDIQEQGRVIQDLKRQAQKRNKSQSE